MSGFEGEGFGKHQPKLEADERYLNRITALRDWREKEEADLVREVASNSKASETRLRGGLNILRNKFNILANCIQVLREEEKEAEQALVDRAEEVAKAEAEGREPTL